MSDKMDELLTGFYSFKKEFENRFDNLENRFDNLEEKVDQISKDVKDIKRSQRTSRRQIAENTLEISDVKEVLKID